MNFDGVYRECVVVRKVGRSRRFLWAFEKCECFQSLAYQGTDHDKWQAMSEGFNSLTLVHDMADLDGLCWAVIEGLGSLGAANKWHRMVSGGARRFESDFAANFRSRTLGCTYL